ncbi:MAG: chorismate synthase [Clostridia bacterium]|nr:chorismate synthase [Clostridia bacterium]
MKNTFGNNVSVTLFGESHGAAIGAVVDGLPAGIPVSDDSIGHQLSLRRPIGKISTPRREADKFHILSGVYNGYTTGTSIAIVIENTNTHSSDYSDMRSIARPGHADYTAYCKYKGYEDYRGGGHFSGRITAALVAAGAVILSALKNKGITIGTHIKSVHGVCDRSFGNIEEDILALADKEFAVLDESVEEQMKNEITKAADQGDSVGGVLESAVCGLPAGVGEPWFDTLEGYLSHILFSVPAIKGVEFGAGFDISNMYGSEANDCLCFDGEKVITKTNNNGGINGGITNGMPVVFRCAVKPTPTIFKEQETVDFKTNENTVISPRGRHDPCIVHRARVVVDSVAAIAVCDMLAAKFGSDWLA